MSADRIRELNDRFRATMTGGRIMMTAGVDALPTDVNAMVLRRVTTFAEFTPDNDPPTKRTISAISRSSAGSSFGK